MRTPPHPNACGNRCHRHCLYCNKHTSMHEEACEHCGAWLGAIPPHTSEQEQHTP